jgi:hypothetical protein
MLGLFKDARLLTPDLPYEHVVARNFSSSYVSPYTANVVLVLYQCTAGPPVVKLLLNEREYVVPGCADLYCPLPAFKRALDHALANCHFDTLCSVDQPQAQPQPQGGRTRPTPTVWDLVHMAGEVLGLYDHV